MPFGSRMVVKLDKEDEDEGGKTEPPRAALRGVLPSPRPSSMAHSSKIWVVSSDRYGYESRRSRFKVDEVEKMLDGWLDGWLVAEGGNETEEQRTSTG